MIDWRLPVVTLSECSDPAALEAKFQEEIDEWAQEPADSTERIMELWDAAQVCTTWLANGGGVYARTAYKYVQAVMESYEAAGLPVREAKERVLIKNATRPRPGGGTGYYSPEVCAEIMAGKWGEK